MNKQQQQNAMLKLATVRLAINHVLRSRAMQKQAGGGLFPTEDGQGLYFGNANEPTGFNPLFDAGRNVVGMQEEYNKTHPETKYPRWVQPVLPYLPPEWWNPLLKKKDPKEDLIDPRVPTAKDIELGRNSRSLPPEFTTPNPKGLDPSDGVPIREADPLWREGWGPEFRFSGKERPSIALPR